jgi:hypothetical protein
VLTLRAKYAFTICCDARATRAIKSTLLYVPGERHYELLMVRNSTEVVAVLGGHKELSDALRVHWRTVYNWTRPGRRIPADMWHQIAAVPRAQEVGITVAVLASLPFNRQ